MTQPLSDRELRENSGDQRAANAGAEFIAEIRETLADDYHGIRHNGNDHRKPLSNCPRCVAVALSQEARRLDRLTGELRALFRRRMREWGYYGENDVEEYLLEAERAALQEGLAE